MITFKDLLQRVNKDLLTEGIQFYQYKAIVRVTYNDSPDLNMGAEKLAEMLRAVPGATRVSTASLDKEHHMATFDVKIISQKAPKECFILFKKNAVHRFGKAILKVEVGIGTIERKNFIK